MDLFSKKKKKKPSEDLTTSANETSTEAKQNIGESS